MIQQLTGVGVLSLGPFRISTQTSLGQSYSVRISFLLLAPFILTLLAIIPPSQCWLVKCAFTNFYLSNYYFDWLYPLSVSSLSLGICTVDPPTLEFRIGVLGISVFDGVTDKRCLFCDFSSCKLSEANYFTLLLRWLEKPL